MYRPTLFRNHLPSPLSKSKFLWLDQQHMLYSSNRVLQQSKSLNDLPESLRQYALMQFLRYPTIATGLAGISSQMIARGGFWRSSVQQVLKPLTKSFSVGDDVPVAVNNAVSLLAKNQILLLDYVEEMLKMPEERQLAFREIGCLLDEIAETKLTHVPIKLTALIGHDLLEKVSRNGSLTPSEQSLLDAETQNVYKLVSRAVEYGKTIFIDQEYPHQRQAIIEISIQLMQHFNNRRPVVYPTIQATDIECLNLTKRILDDTNIKYPAIKLVNGTYVNWANQNGFSSMLQPNKMTSFIHFILIAKHCLRSHIPLFMGTHNPYLESLVDDFAQSINALPETYIKGQLYGFQTQQTTQTLYAIFGPSSSCIDYALRWVIEGAGSNAASSSPILGYEESSKIISKSNWNETLTTEEIDLIVQGVRFNVQDKRVELASSELKATLKSLAF